jgi:hypothetical protein
MKAFVVALIAASVTISAFADEFEDAAARIRMDQMTIQLNQIRMEQLRQTYGNRYIVSVPEEPKPEPKKAITHILLFGSVSGAIGNYCIYQGGPSFQAKPDQGCPLQIVTDAP